MYRFVTLFLCFIAFSCQEISEFDYPSVFTGTVDYIDDTNVSFTAKIENPNDIVIQETGFIWGVYSNDNNGILVKSDQVASGVYTLKANHTLLPNQTYYVRAYAKTPSSIIYGRESSFESSQRTTSLGSWFTISNSTQGRGCSVIQSVATLDGVSYFIFEDGDIYSYNHTSKAFEYLLTNEAIRLTKYSTIYNNQVYIFSVNSFYKFNPADLSITKLAAWPANNRYGFTGFLVGNEIYIGVGQESSTAYKKDFFVYNIQTDSWRTSTRFSGDFRVSPFSFSIGNARYIGGGFNLLGSQFPYPKFNDLWQYNTESGEWAQKASLPFENEDLFSLVGTTYNDTGYCFYQKQLYRYNETFNIWERMANLTTDNLQCSPHVFSYDSKMFVAQVREDDDQKYLNLWSYVN